MILVDDRQGSKHLLKPLQEAGMEVAIERLEFGDVAFAGLGPDEAPVSCAIEIKGVGEMVTDLVKPRFSGFQLPGLSTYDHAWLLIEGACRPNRVNGRLEVPRGAKWKQMKLGNRFIPYQTLWTHLYSLSIKAGVSIIRTYSRPETVWQIITLYRWWERGYDSHHSHDRIYRRPLSKMKPITPHSLVRRVAAELSSVGRVRSAKVEQHFPSVMDMVSAPPEEWASIDGIGKDTARKIVLELEGRNGSR